MEDYKTKLEVIDAICEFHPAQGTEKGWSWYVGGMKDTGEWKVRKMLDVPLPDLQEFLRQLIIEKNKPPLEEMLTEEELADSKKFIEPVKGMHMSVYSYKQLVKWHEERERKLFLGLLGS